MAIPVTPPISDTPPQNSVQPVQGLAQITTNATNTATSATQVTGLSVTFVVQPGTKYLIANLVSDSISNSGANNVIMTVWNGTVGTGTQVGQSTNTAQSGAKGSLSENYMILISSLGVSAGSSVTLNVGMHGSGAGTNTLAAAATYPASFWVDAE